MGLLQNNRTTEDSGRGNFWRLFGNYTRGQALYTRPGAWSRGNSWLAEIPGGFSETTPANKLCTPGRGSGAAAIPGLRKFPAPYWKLHPRTSLVHPAGVLEPRQFLARGNFWRLFGNYAREQAFIHRKTMSCLQIPECPVKKWSPAGSTPSQTPLRAPMELIRNAHCPPVNQPWIVLELSDCGPGRNVSALIMSRSRPKDSSSVPLSDRQFWRCLFFHLLV